MSDLEDRFRTSLEGEIRAGFTTAAQVFAAVEGEVLCDIAVGEAVPGRPALRRTVFSLHCATKPVVAVAVARALEERGLEPSAIVSELLDLDHPCRLTVGEIVDHVAGLGRPDAYRCNFVNPSELDRLLAPAALLDAAEPGVAEYSEVAGWSLLAAVLEALTGTSAVDRVAADLAAQGLGDEVWFARDIASREDVDTITQEVGCYFDTNTGLPLLHDTLERFWNRSLNLTEGGFASISGLGHWYLGVLEVLKGARRPGLPSPEYLRRWLASRRGRLPDRRLRRTCSFAGGFMTSLVDHGFGVTPSPQAVGHSGFLGNSFVLADPEGEVVIGLFRNGIPADPQHDVNLLRPIDVARMYQEALA
jgi:CubicO group peptidase (beta-lactamase class C family)